MNTILTQVIPTFFLLSFLPWAPRNQIKKYIADDSFFLEVKNGKPSKCFTIKLPFTMKGEIILSDNKGPIFTCTVSHFHQLIHHLATSGIITESRWKKILADYEVVGRPMDSIEELSIVDNGELTDDQKAFFGSIYAVEATDELHKFSYTSASHIGECRIEAVRIIDENDNELSGRYCFYSHDKDSAFDIEVDATDLSITEMPLDKSLCIQTYDNFKCKKVEGDVTFQRPELSPVEFSSMVKYLTDVCNATLKRHTTVTELNLNVPAADIAVTNGDSGWLDYILVLDGEMFYLYFSSQTSELEWRPPAIYHLDKLSLLAAVSNDKTSIDLLRKAMYEHINTSADACGYGFSSHAFGNSAGGLNLDLISGGPFNIEPKANVRITAEQFTYVVREIFTSSNLKSGGKASPRDLVILAFTKVLTTLNCPPLSSTEVGLLSDMYGQILDKPSALTVASIYAGLHKLRPNFEVRGSLGN